MNDRSVLDYPWCRGHDCRHDGLEELQSFRIQEGIRKAQERANSPRHTRRPKTAPSMPATPGRAIVEEPVLRPGGAHDPRSPLTWTTDLLAACPSQHLERLVSLKGAKKCIAIHRYRSQHAIESC